MFVGAAGGRIAAAAPTGHAERVSFLLFTPEVARALIAMGQQDATRWLQSDHDGDALCTRAAAGDERLKPPGSLRASRCPKRAPGVFYSGLYLNEIPRRIR